MQLAAVSLDDKYESREGRVHITGSQAIVRLAMMQRIRDRAAGLDTACYITGYRGSPMHNIDKELWSAKRFLPGSNVHFQPAINEDLAATAIWGTQQATVVRRLPARRHLLHVVRQGPRPRPEHGRRPPRPHGGKLPPRRGAGDGRRRPRAHLDRRAGRPRVRLRRAHDALPLSLHRARGAGLRAARDCALPVLRGMGGLQGGTGHGRRERADPGGPLRPGDRAPR